MRITLQWLQEQRACGEQVSLFQQLFGESVELTEQVAKEHGHKFDVNWLAPKVLDKDSLKEYARQRKTLWEEYERQREPLLEEYERQVKPLLEKYERQRKLLLEEYERQEEPLWEEYERQEEPLWEEYMRQRKLLREEYERQREPLWEEYRKGCALAFVAVVNRS